MLIKGTSAYETARLNFQGFENKGKLANKPRNGAQISEWTFTRGASFFGQPKLI